MKTWDDSEDKRLNETVQRIYEAYELGVEDGQHLAIATPGVKYKTPEEVVKEVK